MGSSRRGTLPSPTPILTFPRRNKIGMKTTNFLIALAITFSSALAMAKTTCSATKYKLINDSVTFGMDIKKAEGVLKRKYGSKARILTPQEGLIAVMFNSPQNNLSKILYLAKDGKVTRILFTYATSFVRTFGSNADMTIVMLTKLKERYGQFKDVNQDKAQDKVTFIWGEEGGATLQLLADNDGVDLRIDCDALEREISAEASKNANFGF
jgi:hypothetical protein